MISYSIKLILISGILLLVYHLFLEKEKIHRFNRAYLLFAILFSLIAPFLSFTFYSDVTTISEQYLTIPDTVGPAANLNRPMNYTSSWPSVFMIIYLSICLVLVIRISRTLFSIFSTIRKYKAEKTINANLVVVDKNVSPHSFLNYIFLPAKEFSADKIEPEIISHEMAHVKQKHSWDILFVELVQAICWFNPFLLLYRKAIQLNHEFLADDAVIKNYTDTSAYQYLLLKKSGEYNNRPLSSHFNFFIIKKRLTMMTKTTTRRKALLMQAAIVPLLTGILLVFCTKMNAQDSAIKKAPRVMIPEYTVEGASPALMKEFDDIINKYKTVNSKGYEVYKTFSSADRDRIEAIFKLMSREQQGKSVVKFVPPSKPWPKVVPTENQFELFKNPKQFGVWIDDKKVSNDVLNKYKRTDFSHVFISRLYGFARSSVSYNLQLNLMTNSYYKAYYEREINNKKNGMMIRYSKPDDPKIVEVRYN